MNKRRTKLIFAILSLEDHFREHWTDYLAIALNVLVIILLLLQFWGIIKL